MYVCNILATGPRVFRFGLIRHPLKKVCAPLGLRVTFQSCRGRTGGVELHISCMCMLTICTLSSKQMVSTAQVTHSALYITCTKRHQRERTWRTSRARYPNPATQRCKLQSRSDLVRCSLVSNQCQGPRTEREREFRGPTSFMN